MERNTQRPSINRIQQTCRNIQRDWSDSERERRALQAVARQRQLMEVLGGWPREAQA